MYIVIRIRNQLVSDSVDTAPSSGILICLYLKSSSQASRPFIQNSDSYNYLPPVETIKNPLGCNGEGILRKLVIPVHHSCDAHLANHLRVSVVWYQCSIECGTLHHISMLFQSIKYSGFDTV